MEGSVVFVLVVQDSVWLVVAGDTLQFYGLYGKYEVSILVWMDKDNIKW